MSQTHKITPELHTLDLEIPSSRPWRRDDSHPRSSVLSTRHDSCAAYSGDLVPLGVAGPPVADVEQRGQDDPEPPPTGQPDAGHVEDHVDQGREREEDDAQQRQDERVESRVDKDRSSYPDDEQPESRKDPRKKR